MPQQPTGSTTKSGTPRALASLMRASCSRSTRAELAGFQCPAGDGARDVDLRPAEPATGNVAVRHDEGSRRNWVRHEPYSRRAVPAQPSIARGRVANVGRGFSRAEARRLACRRRRRPPVRGAEARLRFPSFARIQKRSPPPHSTCRPPRAPAIHAADAPKHVPRRQPCTPSVGRSLGGRVGGRPLPPHPPLPHLSPLAGSFGWHVSSPG